MEHRFTGTSRHKVDGKGRVSIPAEFRRVLEAADPEWTEGLNPRLFVHHGPARQTHLDCFTAEAMDEVNAKISRLPRGSKKRRMLEQLYNGLTISTSVDETGRLVLPAWVRDKAGITDNAVLVATGDTFQIWSPDAYARVEAELEEMLDELPDDMHPLELLDLGEE